MERMFATMLTKTFDAIYDGKVLHPLQTLELEPNILVRVILKAPSAKGEAPSEWAENIEETLQELLHPEKYTHAHETFS